jgi:D-glycero-alpha-D-manno-heptose-7-phosphate kinase
MIIGRSPLRITLGGGGTDLPSYYREHGGFLVAAAIDKHVYVAMHRTTLDDMLIRYSQIERPKHRSEIRHPIIRTALELVDIQEPNIEITSMADIPAGTGLGSSGSFATALLKVLYGYRKHFIHPQELAELASHIEIDLLKEPVGKQDTYIAAFGGTTCFTFENSGEVKARPLRISDENRALLEDSLLLFSTGFYREASKTLSEQDAKTRAHDPSMIDNLHRVKEMGQRSCEALERGDLAGFGRLMHEHWEHKKKRSGAMSNPEIDRWYELGCAHGALGGKLIGAGGGGFLMFYTEDKTRLRRAMQEAGLKEVTFGFDFEGTKLL